jgi:hypothetical protein
VLSVTIQQVEGCNLCLKWPFQSSVAVWNETNCEWLHRYIYILCQSHWVISMLHFKSWLRTYKFINLTYCVNWASKLTVTFPVHIDRIKGFDYSIHNYILYVHKGASSRETSRHPKSEWKSVSMVLRIIFKNLQEILFKNIYIHIFKYLVSTLISCI